MESGFEPFSHITLAKIIKNIKSDNFSLKKAI